MGQSAMMPLWTLLRAYVIQVVGELCLSPIGLSVVTKLAPVRLVGLGMDGWFLSIGIGNNLSGIFASWSAVSAPVVGHDVWPTALRCWSIKSCPVNPCANGCSAFRSRSAFCLPVNLVS